MTAGVMQYQPRLKDRWIGSVLHAWLLATVAIYVPALSKVAWL
jgi:hypothetical protein